MFDEEATTRRHRAQRVEPSPAAAMSLVRRESIALPSHVAGVVEFDIHGLAGIRLVDASYRDAAAVARQIGSMWAPLARDPDITVRFVERLPASRRDIALGDARFTDDGFLLIPERGRRHGRALISFDQVGETSEIVCETGSPTVPLLTTIINLTVLAKGAVPVHASAFTFGGTGALVGGWANSGKTTALLAFMAAGAQYVADDYVYLVDGGRRMVGASQPISLSHRHFNDLPEFRAALGWPSRWSLRLGRWIGLARQRAPAPLARSLSGVEARLSAAAAPEELFGRAACTLTGRLDHVFVVMNHDANEVIVEPMDIRHAIRALAASSRHERLQLVSYYLGFRFAFPERENAFIDGVEEHERRALSQALADKNSFVVYHPSPAPAHALFEAIGSHITRH